MVVFHKEQAEKHIGSITNKEIKAYLRYWGTLVPRNSRDVWLRWIFAFMSIHTSWKNNVKGYLAVKNLPTGFRKNELQAAIKSAGVGLDNMRMRGIWEFTEGYRKYDWWFKPRPEETMSSFRDRLDTALYGIGMAKTSFALELIYPVSCGVVCLDTHILRLYGQSSQSPNRDVYHELEGHWRDTCIKAGVPLPIARHIYWDRLQGHEDTRYWAWCLEAT